MMPHEESQVPSFNFRGRTMEQPGRFCFLLFALLSAHVDTGGSLRSKIVGGGESKPHTRTYVAALKGGRGFMCGGFLVAPQWVLTAAHCNGDISVILGAHDLKAVESTQQVFGVKSYHQHPDYMVVAGTPFNDILLLKLDREAKINKYVQVIPLPENENDLLKDTECFVAGWGRIDARYEASSKLFETNVTALGRRKCLQFIPELTDRMVCAGSRAKLCDVSNGDSGSALVCSGVAHGIVSYGFQIPPSIYTRVAAYLPWIKETMKEDTIRLPFSQGFATWPPSQLRSIYQISGLDCGFLQVVESSGWGVIKAGGRKDWAAECQATSSIEMMWRLHQPLLLLLSFSLAQTDPLRSQIVGGHEAKPHSRPYMAALKDSTGNFTCGGFLVRPQWVMTAAHCKKHGISRVVLGAHDIYASEDSQQEIRVAASHPHPEYNKVTYSNDILLLKLDSEAALNKDVALLPLPESSSDIPGGTPCSVAGWGKIEDSQYPEKLYEATVTLYDRKKCQEFMPDMDDGMICAGENRQPQDANEGDSGGPLVCDGVAQGIVSFGGSFSPPGIYTRVTHYLSWIKEVLEL
uniref:transmembrane protease serine 9-like n=1 Tax=Podarcis muralis TaxID=64176 RepID=UPI0010A03ADE|nr:transmembrane protease serine 9-like [Podarcis muralis]